MGKVKDSRAAANNLVIALRTRTSARLRRRCPTIIKTIVRAGPKVAVCTMSFVTMDAFVNFKDKGDYDSNGQTRDQRDLVTQSIISIALGLIAFLTFCVRTRARRIIRHPQYTDDPMVLSF